MHFKFSKKEISDLIVSWLTITVSFAWAISGGVFNLAHFGSVLPVIAIAVGTGFILHELAHKFVAIKFGAVAEYRAWAVGLVIALFGALIGVVFAAPGAVYIFGPHIRKRENGLISLAGPMTNVFIAVFFFLLTIVVPTEIVLFVSLPAISINLFLALFNMLPIPPLDGSKVFIWNPIIWGIVFVPLVLAFLAFRAF
ncbi:MAG: site-2 protease family protein [Candidatus Diapherotrites archaeon]|nr:site-2 protease family protein [Candidatus Diapherotrites archaeon]